jgi:hypothetical protein
LATAANGDSRLGLARGSVGLGANSCCHAYPAIATRSSKIQPFGLRRPQVTC